MSYSTKKRYTSRRERSAKRAKNLKIIFVFALIALVAWVLLNWLYIWDYLRTTVF